MRSFALIPAVLVIIASPVAFGDEYRAKIGLDDGTSLRTTPLVIPTRSGICAIRNLFGDGTVIYRTVYYSPLSGQKASDECPVLIRLTGYQNLNAVLHNNSVIILKRVGGHEGEGSMVSMSTLNAPKEARKAYEQGVDAMLKKKLDAAQKHFETAVELYPKYAPAWGDLGDVLVQKAQPKEAQTAYNRAIEADPKYAKPYLELARLDVAESRLEDAVAITGKGIEQNPTQFPALYFYSALANFSLGRLEPAEKAARRAVELDSAHVHPSAERLLGRILITKGDRPGAIEHLNKYLELSPNASDQQEIKQRVAAIERETAPKQ